MKKEYREFFVKEITPFLIILIFVFSLMIFANIIFQHMKYDELNSEGYVVKFEKGIWNNPNYGCNMKFQNQDGTTSWLSCNDFGNEYSLNNFAVRKDK